jgi:glycosyltransferase involved in cell wall biosynthesis
MSHVVSSAGSDERTVDVIIPAFNAAAYLRETIESVARQTLAPRSVIVVDDGSSDSTLSVLEQLRTELPAGWLQIVSLEVNVGVSAARNAGIARSSATYVAFLDSDDIWEADKLEQQFVLLAASGEDVGVVYCDYRQIDESGRLMSIPRYRLNSSIRGDVRHSLREFNSIAGSGSAVLVRRSLFERTGMFDATLGAAEDWDMWVRLAEVTHFDYVDLPLVRVRRHGLSLQADPHKMADGELRFLDKQLQNGRLSLAHLKRLRRMIAVNRIDISGLSCFDALSPRIRRTFHGRGFSVWASLYRLNVRLRKLVKCMLGMK